MTDAQFAQKVVAPSGALALLARDLLTDFSTTAPDLSGAVVVLPNLHAAAALARAFAAEAGGHVLLPKTTTLQLWAAERPPPLRAWPSAVREAALFEALRSRQWFDAPDLWPLAGELAGLFDELTRFEVELPATVTAFEQALQAAYRAKAGEALQFEARLVHELWHASVQPRDGAGDAVSLYLMQLAQIAETASRPLYAVGLAGLIPAERAFFERYALRMPVRFYQVDGSAKGASLSARFYASAWPSPASATEALRARAAAFADACPISPVHGSLSMYGAASLEQEARAAETQVRRWLVDGKEKIAVVALDRLVARRARALLERSNVMVNDETGWIFSTTSASTVIMRWLDAVSSGFFYEDLLDLIKSPFVLHGWEPRREAVYQLESVIRSRSVVAGLDACLSALHAQAGGEVAYARELLQRLAHAERILRRDRRRRLHDWLSLLFGSLAALGVDEGLGRDPAGLQLLELLRRLGRDLEGSEEAFSFSEWRRWLNRQLELAEFRDTGVSSPVVFTQLSLTRLRDFDAVAIVGCDASRLPGLEGDHLFFNQSVRAQLGLPTHERQLEQIRDDLTGLLSRSGNVLVTWQRLCDGEPNLLSPVFERIDVFHQLGWNNSLMDSRLERVIGLAEVAVPDVFPVPGPSTVPAPTVPVQRVPARISASGYNSLLACPYQFYGRYVLRLRESEEVREEMEKRDYGEYVHRVLRRFHARYPVCTDVPREQLEDALRQISDEVFRGAIASSYLSHAWALRWRATMGAYLDWQLEREQQGWYFVEAETERDTEVRLADGTAMILEGRLDRVDQHKTGAYAVLDYKTRAAADLRKDLKEPGEDVQLPVYAALQGGETREAFYLALERGQVQVAALSGELLQHAEKALERLQDVFVRIRAGAPLAAQGADFVCVRCEMRGLCRKQYWT